MHKRNQKVSSIVLIEFFLVMFLSYYLLNWVTEDFSITLLGIRNVNLLSLPDMLYSFPARVLCNEISLLSIKLSRRRSLHLNPRLINSFLRSFNTTSKATLCSSSPNGTNKPSCVLFFKSSFNFSSKNKRHIFHFHQALYWTIYLPFCSTTFCHFSGNFIIPSSSNILSDRSKYSFWSLASFSSCAFLSSSICFNWISGLFHR